MQELVIHAELKDLLPPLSESEYSGLEADIIARGCISPIVIWNGTIVDGHHRYRICRKHKILFQTETLEFASLDDAMFWAWTHQENRRNLTPYQRGEIALRFKSKFVVKARANMVAGGGDQKSDQAKSGFQMSGNPVEEKVHVDKKLAKQAGISHDTMHKIEFIDRHVDDETKNKLRQGETTINREYRRAKEDAAQTEKVDVTPKKNVPCIEELTYVQRTTLKDIRQDKPDHLLCNLASHFRKGFIEDLILEAMDFLHEKHGDAVTTPIAEKIAKRYLKSKKQK